MTEEKILIDFCEVYERLYILKDIIATERMGSILYQKLNDEIESLYQIVSKIDFKINKGR